MIGARERNGRRLRAVRMARAFKAVFQPMAIRDARVRLAGSILLLIAWLTGGRQAWRRWIYRIVFTEGDTRRMAARAVLADLRDFTFAQSSAFDRDPIIMARRQGRRDVWLRIANYLNLDEAEVQLFMEQDDE
ncbi:MAG: hypothetical protein IIZ30_07335 [Sphingomonas sp.]|uniref:Bbp19 family protein n=1 Tax=Sphingomonas sp. TaxID=28214 RepID=UPI00257C5D37|nr:hypothetical protein [Sphingomonas sp.]MBQ1479833.1 hypothetical protein [Sphingomonas sp.]